MSVTITENKNLTLVEVKVQLLKLQMSGFVLDSTQTIILKRDVMK